MKKIFVLLIVFVSFALSQESEKKNDFMKQLSGLESDYVSKQLDRFQKLKNKRKKKVENEPKKALSEDDKEKQAFEHQRDLAKITDEFAKSKRLKDLQISSMYRFNGKNYVVFKLNEEDDEVNNSNDDEKFVESTYQINGRYQVGDDLLTHKIISINQNTKSVQLYKKIDEQRGYKIYLSNYGLSVSDMIVKEKKESKPTKRAQVNKSHAVIKDRFKNEKFSNNETKSIVIEPKKEIKQELKKAEINQVKKEEAVKVVKKSEPVKQVVEKQEKLAQKSESVKVEKRIEEELNQKRPTPSVIEKKADSKTVEAQQKDQKSVSFATLESLNIKENPRLEDSYMVKSVGLNIRSSNSKESKVAGYLKKGDIVYSQTQKEGWIKILKVDKKSTKQILVYKDQEKWVKNTAKVLTPYKKEESSNSEIRYMVIANALNIRSKQDLKSKVVGLLKKSDQVVVLKDEGEWLKLKTLYKKGMKKVEDVSAKSFWIRNRADLIHQL